MTCVSRLVHAEVEGEHLDEREYTNFFQLFIFAGNETTRTGISHGILALMEHPDQLDAAGRGSVAGSIGRGRDSSLRHAADLLPADRDRRYGDPGGA